MSQLFSNCPPYWNSNDHQNSGSLSKGLSLKVDSPPHLHLKARSLCFSLQDHDSSSSQSTYSNHDLAATAGTNSQEQCLSSESGQEVSCAKNGGQIKPVYLMDLTNGSFNAGQIDYDQAMTYMPYSCADPNFNGLMTAYGPPPVIHPHMMGVTNPRVPLLPLDISDDEPIYVNAKQYHGILRRRQFRAKMEAQNKLIKVRKPYLHESRHLHALNRVRGTGGRFLSTKKSQQSDSNSTTPNHAHLRSTGFDHNGNTLIFEHHQSTRDPEAGNSNGIRFFHHPDHGFSGMQSSHGAGTMQRNAGFMNNSNQHYASVVQ